MSLSSDYKFVDRLLHYIALFHPAIQKVFCEIENDLFRRQFGGIISNDLISTNIQPGSRGELLGGAHCRQDHEPEIDHGDEHDTVSARYEPV